MATQGDKEFAPTAEELEAIGKAMKDENFRQLLAEYAEEISNPENKRKYEEELRQMEAMQGNDVKFINPEPGFVVKTKLQDTAMKVFLNICQSDVIEKPTSKRAQQGNQTGLQWSVPHSITKHREDLDKAGNTCIVYDVVFHPQSLRLASTDQRFKQMVVDTAFDGIEQRFPHHKLDRSVQKTPKMKYKGMPSRSVIRSKNGGVPAPTSDTVADAARTDLFNNNAQEPSGGSSSSDSSKGRSSEDEISGGAKQTQSKGDAEKQQESAEPTASGSGDIVPVHRVVYRRAFDMSDVRDAPDAGASTRPEAIVVSVELPKCKSAARVDLDVEERSLSLSSDVGPYALNLPLHFPVDDENGTAKFDKSKRILTVTLPVLPAPASDSDATTPTSSAAITPMLGSVDEAEGKASDALQGAGTVSDTTTDNGQEKEDRMGREQQQEQQEQQERDGGSRVQGEAARPDDDGNGITAERKQQKQKQTPHVNFVQTEDKLSIIIEAPGLEADGVCAQKHVISFGPVEVHGLNVQLSDTTTVLFSFDACFEEDAPACDVGPENVVVIITKTPAISWQRVRYGVDEKHLRERLLFTATNAKSDISALPDPWSERGTAQAAKDKRTKAEAKEKAAEAKKDSAEEEKNEAAPDAKQEDTDAAAEMTTAEAAASLASTPVPPEPQTQVVDGTSAKAQASTGEPQGTGQRDEATGAHAQGLPVTNTNQNVSAGATDAHVTELQQDQGGAASTQTQTQQSQGQSNKPLPFKHSLLFDID